MQLYIDIISGDELFTDDFPVKEVGGAYEVECKLIEVSADAEEGPSGGKRTVLDVVFAHSLQPTSFDKKSYGAYLTRYLKAVKTKLTETAPESVEVFEKESAALAKRVLANFRDYDPLTGQSMNSDGAVALLNYRDDGTTPYLTFFKHGVEATEL
ncbi:translationally-controlled tumor protein [Streptomyces arenae]|uniref:translationally-controlled tumor protein n=1 Tax=Streptomyces arenae TaxID=29301 RepID=UPI00265961BF|nr:translationally-controlled tumor protein [Streptomyces arenae]MCG7209385.1 translationally-controlled tumor protein [Streptomyces arenae]